MCAKTNEKNYTGENDKLKRNDITRNFQKKKFQASTPYDIKKIGYPENVKSDLTKSKFVKTVVDLMNHSHLIVS